MFYRQVLLSVAMGVSVLGVTAAAAAAGQEQPKCFCLRHKATGSMAYFGCERVSAPNKFTKETQCWNAAITAKTKIKAVNAYEVVANGKDGCHPCIPELPLPPQRRLDHPRGNEEGQKQ